MPHHCSVSGCTSNSKSSPSLSFHSFPSDTDVWRVWICNICRDERQGQWTINASTHVCSLHFKDDSYHEARWKRERKMERKNRMLKPGSSPTIFECFPECLHPTLSKRKAPVSRHLPSPKQRDLKDFLPQHLQGTLQCLILAMMPTFQTWIQMMLICPTSIASVYKNCRSPYRH